MAQANLNVDIREQSGKGVARRLRSAGRLPAVVYGKDLKAQPISVDPKELETIIYGEGGANTLITLKGAAGLDGKVVILKDVDYHPLRRDMVCADFHALNLKDKSSFMVPVEVIGTAAGQKEGGSLQVIRHELEVYCLPADVPQSIEIDVSALEIGDTIHVEEVKVPEDVELVYDVNFTVVTVSYVREEVEEPEEGEELEAEAETPEAEDAEESDTE